MTITKWRKFLQKWSDEWLERDEKFPARVKKTRWLGFRPATTQQINRLEKRLGYTLPPSYRNFLLTTNGWRHTSELIETIRPTTKVEWLQTDNPQLVDGFSEDDVDRLSNYSTKEYFSYDGRPIFDWEQFRQSLIIADPVAGDSLIYVLNPAVVAKNGEWEAWRFAHWIPGAERFPSFEILMQAEYALFSDKRKTGVDRHIGPFKGVYAPDRPRHAAQRIGPGRIRPRRLTVPELIDQLESPNQKERLAAAAQLFREYGIHYPEDEHPELVGQLGRIIRSRLETDVRQAAAAMLGTYGDSSAIPLLIEALADPEVVPHAIGALFYLSIYMHDFRIGDAVVRLLESPQSYHICQHAIYILEELKDARVAEIGLRLLDQDQHTPFAEPKGFKELDISQGMGLKSQLRFLGAFAFAKFATNATEQLVQRLNHPEAAVRAAAVAALREDPKRGPHLSEALTPLLADVDPVVQNQASMTLRFLKPMPKVEISAERIAEIEKMAIAQMRRARKRTNRF